MTLTLPVVSIAKSSPRPPVASLTAWIQASLPWRELKQCVAPIAVATSSLDGEMSTAMMVLAAERFLAAAIAARPTAPTPNTPILEPGPGLHTFKTVPEPVMNPQPNDARRAHGTSPPEASFKDVGFSLTQERTLTFAKVAKVDCPKNLVVKEIASLGCSSSVEVEGIVWTLSVRVPNKFKARKSRQAVGTPERQLWHAEHDAKERTTRSPFCRWEIPGPTSTISPAPSWPRMAGSCAGRSPSAARMSIAR